MRRLSHRKRAVRPEVSMKLQQHRAQSPPPSSSSAMAAYGGRPELWMMEKEMSDEEGDICGGEGQSLLLVILFLRRKN